MITVSNVSVQFGKRVLFNDEMGRKLQDMNLMTRKRASGRRK